MNSLLFVPLLLASINLLLEDECVIYTNHQDEVIVVDVNRLSYRLRNPGGIITYSYFSGDYSKQGRRYKLGEDTQVYFTSHASSLLETSDGEGTICFYDRDGSSIRGAAVTILQNEETLKYYLDTSECIMVQNNLGGSDLYTFNLYLLGNTFSGQVKVANGETRRVKLKVPVEYGIQNGKESQRKLLKVKVPNDDIIKVYDSVSRAWKEFYKAKSCLNCHEAIFNIID
jgi:hypothetical protein